MKMKHPLSGLALLEAISQNLNTVATAEPAGRGGGRRTAVGNATEAPRHSEAATTFMRRLLAAFVLTIVVFSEKLPVISDKEYG